uniref:Uncharacterized protein n=3 Tax=Lotharella globosa TaxID=91324 RepID=A0A7S4E0J8_9EUKA
MEASCAFGVINIILGSLFQCYALSCKYRFIRDTVDYDAWRRGSMIGATINVMTEDLYALFATILRGKHISGSVAIFSTVLSVIGLVICMVFFGIMTALFACGLCRSVLKDNDYDDDARPLFAIVFLALSIVYVVGMGYLVEETIELFEGDSDTNQSELGFLTATMVISILIILPLALASLQARTQGENEFLQGNFGWIDKMYSTKVLPTST